MNYHLLELKLVTSKDAESSCREIAGALPINVIQNTTSFLGDTAAVQIKTQRLLAMHFDMITGNQEHLPQYTCLLHTGKSNISSGIRLIILTFSQIHFQEIAKDDTTTLPCHLILKPY